MYYLFVYYYYLYRWLLNNDIYNQRLQYVYCATPKSVLISDTVFYNNYIL